MRTAVIGGGAAGLTASIAAAENGGKAVIYESGARCGRKILATGNGRCNMTNRNADLKNYHGKNPDFIKGAMHRFWVEDTIEFFESLGIVCKTEEKGKVYPFSDQASAVLDVLRMKCENLGIDIITDFEVKGIRKTGKEFEITSYGGKRVYSDTVIVASGGKAAPNLGAKGTGYEILKSFGHTVTELKPSLVQIKTETDIVKKLKGIKFTGAAKLGKYSEEGEILFTDYGLSGPPIFSLSSYLDNQKTIELDMMVQYSEDEIKNMLYMRMCSNPQITLENFFVGMLNKKVGMALLKSLDIAPLSRKACTLGEKEIERTAHTIKNWQFKICGTMSWNNAQVTRGGVLTNEFNPVTMESKLVEGLYAAGEIMDIDGDCGGYNLQWAWSSGTLAGRAAAGRQRRGQKK